jgi:hypothetical protein
MNALGIAVIAVAIAAYVPYLWEVLRGQGRPNRASWMIFSATGLFAAGSAWAGGARDGLWVPLVYGVLSFVVVLVAIRRGEGGWSSLDRFCLATALLSLVGWWLAGDPLVCVAMNALADTAGHFPTIRKAWREPRHEPIVMWWCVLVANIGNLVHIQTWSAIEILYPLSLTWNAVAVISAWLLGWMRMRRERTLPDATLQPEVE